MNLTSSSSGVWLFKELFLQLKYRMRVKAGIHYQVFAPIYSLDNLTLVAESQSKSADLS